MSCDYVISNHDNKLHKKINFKWYNIFRYISRLIHNCVYRYNLSVYVIIVYSISIVTKSCISDKKCITIMQADKL